MAKRVIGGTLIILLCFTFFAETVFASPLLRIGSTGPEVVRMQQRLIDLGYLNGRADGIFGPITRNAVIQFQRSKNLTVDGIAGPQTLSALYNTTPSSGNSSNSSGTNSGGSSGSGSSTSYVSITRILRRGSTGSDVRTLQSRLNELGYNCGKVDGIFGGLTHNAVVLYQRDNKLIVDGIVGPQTVNSLFRSQSSSGGLSDSNQTPSNPPAQNEPPRQEDPKPEPPKQENPIESVPITGILRRGSRGSEVAALQTRLNELGFNCGATDGIFGPATESAVMAFQRANGLTADGIVGPKTIAKLYPVKANPQDTKEPDKPFQQFKGTSGVLTGKTIVVDPGHGGTDSGAVRDGVTEKYIVLDIALRLQRILEEAGANVIMTRTTDRTVSLFSRSAYVNVHILALEKTRLEGEINKIDELIEKNISDKREAQDLLDLITAYEIKKNVLIQAIEEYKNDNSFADPFADISRINTIEADIEHLEDQILLLENKISDYEENLEELLKDLDITSDTNNLEELRLVLETLKEELYESEGEDAIKLEDAQGLIGYIQNNKEELERRKIDFITRNDELNELKNRLNGFNLILADFNVSRAELVKHKSIDDVKEFVENQTEDIRFKGNSYYVSISGAKTSVTNQIKDFDTAKGALNQDKLSALADVNWVKSSIQSFRINYLNNLTNANRSGIYRLGTGSVSNSIHYAGEDLKRVFDISNNYYDDVVLVSIHSNSTTAHTQTTASGVQVYYRDNNSTTGINRQYYTNYNSSKRKGFAEALLKHINASTNFNGGDTVPRRADFSVLRENNIASALVEVGFMNNPNDMALLKQEQTRENAAAGMYKGIVEYFNK